MNSRKMIKEIGSGRNVGFSDRGNGKKRMETIISKEWRGMSGIMDEVVILEFH